MQEKTTSSENTSSKSSQNIHQRKYLCEGIHVQSSILYLSEGQNSGCQMSGSVIHIYKERFFDQCTRILLQSGFYTSQKV